MSECKRHEYNDVFGTHGKYRFSVCKYCNKIAKNPQYLSRQGIVQGLKNKFLLKVPLQWVKENDPQIYDMCNKIVDDEIHEIVYLFKQYNCMIVRAVTDKGQTLVGLERIEDIDDIQLSKYYHKIQNWGFEDGCRNSVSH